jgi:uncharacterized membrane protein YedE/YeeE
MKRVLIALASGTLFGAGLTVSQMTNPAKVLAFLDVTGAWDASLAFVMGTALLVSAVSYRIARARDPLAGAPGIAGIDARLLVGASLFGAGWGLAGLCPGPAIAALVTGSTEVILFVAAMLSGMALFQLFVPAAIDTTRDQPALERHAA